MENEVLEIKRKRIIAAIEKCNDAKEILEASLAVLEEKPKAELRKLEMGDEYWHVDEDGAHISDSWDCMIGDERRRGFGNVHQTEQQAKQAAAHTKIINLLRRFAMENNRGDWKFRWKDRNQEKHYIHYDHPSGDWNISNNLNCATPESVYFASRKIAKAAIEFIRPYWDEYINSAEYEERNW